MTQELGQALDERKRGLGMNDITRTSKELVSELRAASGTLRELGVTTGVSANGGLYDRAAEKIERLTGSSAELLSICIQMRDWLRPEVVKEPDRTFFWQLHERIEKFTKDLGATPEPSARHSALADELEAADVETIMQGDLLGRIIDCLRAAQPPAPDDVVRDAERWRALIGCARVRVLGSAGIRYPGATGYAHIGVEFWTHHPTPTDPTAIEDLVTFTERATATKPAECSHLPKQSAWCPKCSASGEEVR